MAFDLGTASGTIRLNYAGGAAKAAIADATGIDRSFTKAGSSLARFAKIGAAGLGAALVGGLAVAVKTAASFEKQMSAVAAVSGANEQQLESLRQKALQLGADTAFSANEAGLAIEELVKAGLTIPEVLGGAADATVALAAAAGIELPEAATIASNAMNQFGISATDMTATVDDIAGVANTSAIDVSQFGQSLKQVGAVANTVGLSFEDTATAIGLMGDAGIVGSDAGTSLKTMLLNLQPTTEKQTTLFKELGLITKDGSNAFFDQAGNVKNLAQLSGVLQRALQGQTRQQKLANLETLFGTDAIRAAAIISNTGAQGVEKFAKAMNKVSAADVAAKRMDNFSGSVEQLKGSIETLLINLGTPLLDPLRQVVDFATRGANALSEMASGAREPPEALQQLQIIAQNLWQTLENLWNAVADSDGALHDLATGGLTVVIGALRIASELLETLSGMFGGLGGEILVGAGAWLLLGGRVTALVGALKLVPTAAGLAALSLRNFSASAVLASGAAKGIAGAAGLGLLIHASGETNSALGALTGAAGGAALGFSVGGPFGAAVGGAAGLIYGLNTAMNNAEKEANELSATAVRFADQFETAKQSSNSFRDSLNQVTGAATRATAALIRQNLASSKLADGQTLVQTVMEAGLDPQRALAAALDAGGKAGNRFFASLRKAEDQGRITGEEYQELVNIIFSQNRVLESSRQEWADNRALMGRSIVTTREWKALTKSLPKQVVTLIKEQGSDIAMGDVKQLQKQYDLTPKQVRTLIALTGADEAMSDAQQLKAYLDSLDGTVSRVTIERVTNYIPGVGYNIPQAHGGILGYANGGFPPGIYNGTRIKFAEAGQEAYIPMRPDKRRRAEGIMRLVARSFGGEFIKYAEGGLLNMASGWPGPSMSEVRQPNLVREIIRETKERRTGPAVVNIYNPKEERSSMSLINTLTTLGHTGHL